MLISIHAPTRGATLCGFLSANGYKFQSTLPREERHKLALVASAFDIFQSTLPREERQNIYSGITNGVLISIHAPTRGATYFFPLTCSALIFQSTLPREERHIICHMTICLSDFNPRSHERSDVGIPSVGSDKKISIHAPTRGATQLLGQVISLRIKFQSTLPREERRSTNCFAFLQRHFNPRSHERSDSILTYATNDTLISIHAPTRGATDTNTARISHGRISIHAPTRGATNY